ncbi:MAG: UDP-3-O-(3-hydroxymyristoyl)glucosamine N-acyltransferase [Planctomycetota bacterium]|jgi:UDP-3-O-[3-hydroxymyristoyl] glucosamine N-acyltransferase
MNTPSFTLLEIAEICDGRFVGSAEDGAHRVSRVAPIQTAEADSVTWLVSSKHRNWLKDCNAGAVIGDAGTVAHHPRGIVCNDPELALAKLLKVLRVSPSAPEPGIHPSAFVDPSAVLGKDVAIGPGCVVKSDASIGDGSILHAGVTIGAQTQVGCRNIFYDGVIILDRIEIGNDVIIHAGAVIGTDGFGYVFRDGRHIKLEHLGTVVIEDEVEIGANSCIDRGKVGATRIGRGVKIDNLVMVAHNVQIGPLSILAAQVGVAGSTVLGQGVMLAGQSGVTDNVVVGDGARVGGGGGVAGNLKPGADVWGTPARDHREYLRELVKLKSLDKMKQRIADLEARLAEIEQLTNENAEG